jgi:hypothetical protein
MKISAARAELFHADRRTEGKTDMTKLIVAFRNFANAPKNCIKVGKYQKYEKDTMSTYSTYYVFDTSLELSLATGQGREC